MNEWADIIKEFLETNDFISIQDEMNRVLLFSILNTPDCKYYIKKARYWEYITVDEKSLELYIVKEDYTQELGYGDYKIDKFPFWPYSPDFASDLSIHLKDIPELLEYTPEYDRIVGSFWKSYVKLLQDLHCFGYLEKLSDIPGIEWPICQDNSKICGFGILNPPRTSEQPCVRVIVEDEFDFTGTTEFLIREPDHPYLDVYNNVKNEYENYRKNVV